jgi:hypothetical protein
MSRLPWLNALLLAIVAALGALAYFKPGTDAPAEHALSALKAAAASSIRIERTGAQGITLERKEGRWVMTAPLAARADASRVERLLEIVEAKSVHRTAATALERFALAPPAARVTIAGQTFGFGMVNAVTREQYVLTGDAVYAVNPRYGTALPAGPLDLASRQLLGPGEIPLKIELKEFAVEQRDGRWTLAPAPAGGLSQDELARWVDGWRSAGAIRVEPHAGGKPRADVRIQLKGGGSLALGVLSSGANLVLARPDEKLQYHFRVETAKRPLSPPGAGVRSETADKK